MSCTVTTALDGAGTSGGPWLRPARASDARAIRRIQVRAIASLSTYTRDQRRAWMATLSQALVEATLARRIGAVAFVARRFAGFSQLDPERARLTALYVDPTWQRRGLGSLLLARVVQCARELGASGLLVSSSLDARPFYARHGFHVTGWREQTVPGGPTLVSTEMALRWPDEEELDGNQ